jgi:hypothetical protein
MTNALTLLETAVLQEMCKQLPPQDRAKSRMIDFGEVTIIQHGLDNGWAALHRAYRQH